MKRAHLISWLFICLLFLTEVICAQAPATAPDTLKVAGLRERVTVRRDERHIPYIEAANEHDLYFAQGFVTASDRLWQMDLLRRNARGELAEIFGNVAVNEDIRRRKLGFAKFSEDIASKMTGAARDVNQAFADGVNAFITQQTEATLPVEFRILKYAPRQWTIADSMVISFMMMESLSTTWSQDVMRAAFADLPAAMRKELLMEFTPMDTPVVGSDKNGKQQAKQMNNALPVSRALIAATLNDEAQRERSLALAGLHAEGLAASNNWVVSGKKTASGKPLLSNDPHLAPSIPNIWYLVHLSAPGVRVAGVSIPGIAAVIIGHNEHIAWGMTNLAPDVQDLYREKFDGSRYLTPSGWKEAEVRTEQIKVRKQPTNPETETQEQQVIVTRHGPIVLEENGERYALRWSLYDTPPDSILAFHQLNRARNWSEFQVALKGFAGATQNFVYADVDGHIGYYGAGKIPTRQSGDGSVPYDGTKGDGEWTGRIPFEKLPHVFDPPSGIIATANARIVGRDYPFHLTHAWSAPYRQKRINDLLAAKSKITIEDFRAVLGDTYAIGGATFARAAAKALAKDADAQATIDLLTQWDGKAQPDSRAALLVHEWRDAFSNRVFKSALGEEKFKLYRWTNRHALLDRIVTEWPRHWLPKDAANWQVVLKETLAETRAALAKRLGEDKTKWTFGNGVQVQLAHPLARAPLVGSQFKIAPFGQTGNGYAGGIGPTVNV
ncbi:MAG: penicillin acylase family protein, partial [Acidobacteria bacterium]|nr:penicillin acylase family protein [Acidobacteriota bacterium]